MTSSINPAPIDGTYPVAGRDNNSQGFRDNFTNIKQNLQLAADELTDLQSKALLKSALTGTTLDNDLEGAVLANAAIQGTREVVYALGSVSGAQTISFNNGSYQTLTLAGSVTLAFSNFSATSGQQVRIRLAITVPNSGYTVTLPASVTQNLSTIAGVSSQTITFDTTGTYILELSTVNGGTTFSIADVTRNRNTIQGGSLTVSTIVSNAAVNGITMTVSNVAGAAVGNITATNFIGNIINVGSNSASFTGNVTANNLIANTSIVGTLATALQPNVTLVGTLSSLMVTGNSNIGNLNVTNGFDICGYEQFTGLQYVANAANGSSVTIYSNVVAAIIAPNAVIASYTITMPTTPSNGQVIYLTFANTITSLTHTTTGGQVLKGGFTTANANVGGQWMYYTDTNTWYKIN